MKRQTEGEKRICERLSLVDEFLLAARRSFAMACCACASRRSDADVQVLDALATVDQARVEVRQLFDLNVGEGIDVQFPGKRRGRPPKVKPDAEGE